MNCISSTVGDCQCCRCDRGTTGCRIGIVSIPRGIGSSDGIHDASHAFDDVIHKGKVSSHLATVVDFDWSIEQDGVGELEESHIGTSPRAVYGKKPKTVVGS